jgi:hypothetical protein
MGELLNTQRKCTLFAPPGGQIWGGAILGPPQDPPIQDPPRYGRFGVLIPIPLFVGYRTLNRFWALFGHFGGGEELAYLSRPVGDDQRW